MKRWISVLAIELGTAAIALAENDPPICGELLALSFNTEAWEHPREYHRAGRWATVGSLTPLDAGRYVYLITDQEEVLFSEAVPDRTLSVEDESAKILVSHRSLMRQMAVDRGADAKVIAAGEWRIIARPDFPDQRFVQSLSNRSNSFRGGEERLHHAAGVLKAKGLDIEKGRSALLDFGGRTASFDFHVSSVDDAIYTLQTHNDPTINLMQGLEWSLSKIYPHQHIYFAFDSGVISELLMKIAHRLVKQLIKMDKSERETALTQIDLLMSAVTLTKHWHDRGVPYVVASLNRLKLNPHKMIDTITAALASE